MLSGLPVNASEGVVTFGVDSDYPPFSFIVNNTAQGYELDLIKLIFEKGDYTLEFKHGYSWNEIYERTTDGRLDFCGPLVKTPEREKQVLFTDDAYNRYYGIFTNENAGKIALKDLAKYRLGAVKGYYSEVIVRDQLKSADYLVFDTFLEMITALKGNRIDAFIEITEVVKYYIAKSNLVGQITLQHDGLFPQGAPYGISKSRPDLVRFINKRLKEIKASGEYEILYVKNFSAHSADYYDEQKRMYVWMIIGLIASALLFIILLKLQVKRATVKIIQRELEIRSKNEELESLNEELNATLEEMEASNEELISTSESLRNSEEKFRNLVRDMQVGVLIQGPKSEILMSNPKALELLGLSEDQLLGKTSFDPDWNVIHEDGSNFPGETHPVPEAIAARRAVHDVVMGVYRPVSGDRVWMIVYAEPELNSDGSVSHVVCTLIDITRLKRSEEALRKSEDYLSAVFDSLSDAVFVDDADTGEIIDVNRSMCEMYGYTYDEALRTPIGDLSQGEPPYSQNEAMEWLRKARESGPQRFEWFAKRKNGEIFSVEINMRFAVIGGENRFVVTARDITERKQSEERIKSLLAGKELLLNEVHHRIKNNMNTIKGLLTLQLTAEDNPSAAASLRDAESRVQSMIMLYDRLYSTENFRELSVKEYLQPLAGEIVGSFPNFAKVKIETDIEDFVLNVQTLSPLGIIINELLTNMMKYAFTGRESGVIKLSAFMRGNRASISLRDNGVGLPESISFENSTGFGLELVNMLVMQIGGSIRIERGEGTRFVLEFTV
jgi:PAS domain S-box-containing protein